MRKQYSAEYKAQVVREVLKEEKTLGQIASEYGVHSTQIAQWRDRVLCEIPELLSRKGQKESSREADFEKEREALYAEIGRLTTELAWLKKKAGYNGQSK
jgi:transposase-like protein